MENYQEIPPEIQEVGFSSDATIYPPPTTTTTSASESPVEPLERCNSCGSLKRRSTSSLPSLQEPAPKRANFHSSVTGATADGRSHQLSSEGSRELPVANSTSPAPRPPSSSNVKQNVLDRSISDITSYMGTQETGEFSANVLPSPGNSKNNVVSPSPFPAVGSLSPLPQSLRRSVSDPTGSDVLPEATTTPSRPPAAGTFSSSPSYGQESTDSKRLRSIKERMKEISQWMEEFAPEEDKDGTDDAVDKISKDISQNESHARHEEAVWAERTGDGLVLHFKCPCGKGYEIFLSGKKCYYRLI